MTSQPAPRAAFRPEDPDLAGYVVLDFTAFDWLEDDEEIIGHPRDPFHRVDIRGVLADVEVALDGVTLAKTNGAQLLYETYASGALLHPAVGCAAGSDGGEPQADRLPVQGPGELLELPGVRAGQEHRVEL